MRADLNLTDDLAQYPVDVAQIGAREVSKNAAEQP